MKKHRRKTSIPAKITFPVPIRVYPRRRLFRLLDKMLNYPVLWIASPPGSGKTALISSYLADQELPCIWYHVDEKDGDAAQFFSYMTLAVKHSTSSYKKKQLPSLTSKRSRNIVAFTKHYFESLYKCLKPPFFIVFDNYQDIPDISTFHTIINYGLAMAPQGIHSIVLSRREPPDLFIRLRANNTICLLGWNEIRFTLKETAGIARVRGKEKLSGEKISKLYRKTEGWGAGLILMLESIKTKYIDFESMNKQVPEEIFRYFISEIFGKTGRQIQKFLLKTAFLPTMTIQTTKKLTGITCSKRILSHLHQNNYFTERLLPDGPVYQYFPLFREFLLSKAMSTFTKKELHRIRRNAASLLKENGQGEYAAELLRDAKDWRGLSRLIRNHTQLLTGQKNNEIPEKWLADVPESIIRKFPWFSYWKGVFLLSSLQKGAIPYFKRAFFLFYLFYSKKDIYGASLACSGIVDVLLLHKDDCSYLDKWIVWVNKHIGKKRFLLPVGIEVKIVSSMLGAIAWRQPCYVQKEYWIERATVLIKSNVDINGKIKLGYHLLSYFLFSGSYIQATSLMETLKPSVTSKNLLPCIHLMWCLMEASFSYHVFVSPESCLKSVRKGLEISKKTNSTFLNQSFFLYGAFSTLILGNLSIVEKFLEKLTLLMPTFTDIDLSDYYYLCGSIAFYKKDYHRALYNFQVALQLSAKVRAPVHEFMKQIGVVLAFYELGDRKKATGQFLKARRVIRGIQNNLAEFTVLLFQAQRTLDKGDEPKGMRILHKALTLGKEGCLTNTMGQMPPWILRLFMRALDAGIEVAYVRGFIQKYHLIPDIPPLDIENWPWPLKIYTLGQFHLQKQGKPVQSLKKAQQKPLTMLKVLIALGGKEIKEERLTDILWPDAEGDAAHSAFTTTLARLRRLILCKHVILVHEGMITLNPRYCWVDVWAFDRIFDQFERKWENTKLMKDTDQAIVLSLSEKIFHLYRGQFLPSDTQQVWTLSSRERLRNRFIRFVAHITQYYEQKGEWEKAKEYYQKGIDIDDTAEELYQGLMICYLQTNQQSKAIEVYQRCKIILSKVHRLNPSSKTKVIYQSMFLPK
ncbi:MAG: hypothetical protein E3K32_01985 [wastewater metagenome]|nr:hypothetical protein [Candidatus Loosdrechtia aerotolerans]